MDPIADTLRKVRRTITRYGMIDPGDLLVVAVSGGPDSVCLLDVLHRLRDEMSMDLIVAHFDHGLRPHEDESETGFVRELASFMELPFETARGSLLTEGKAASLEERARDARYAFLKKVKTRYGARKIAVGHNLNDQAETVLMRLLRGSGPSGLAGIPPCRGGEIIRPLIEIDRDTVLSYLEARGLDHVTDSTNLQPACIRNRIRLQLLPGLLEYQPRLIEHLGQLAHMLREEDAYLDLLANQWIERESEEEEGGGELTLPLCPFLFLEEAMKNRVVRQVLKRLQKDLRRIGLSHIRSVCGLASSPEPQGFLNLPGGLRAVRVYDRLVFSTGPVPEKDRFHLLLQGPGTYSIGDTGRFISISEVRGKETHFEGSPWTACIDAGKIQYPLLLRNPRPGDRFVPLGMKGRKKIKDFFIDLKVPSSLRASTPILTSRDTPVWVCGYRIDDRFKVTPETLSVLRITIT